MAKQPRTSGRVGAIAHEAAIALVVTCGLLTGAIHVMSLSARETRALNQRLTASLEAADLMEQLMAKSWQQVTPETAASLALSDTCQATLPHAELAVDVTTAADGEKRLTIEITWQRTAGQPTAPVQLVAWKFASEEAGP